MVCMPFEFLCVEHVEYGGANYYGDEDRWLDADCYALRLNYLYLWFDWAKPLRAGAFFAFLAATIGFVALALLLTATCFALEPKLITRISFLLGAAGVSQTLTFVAFGIDKEGKKHMAVNANMSLFASIIYFVACSSCIVYNEGVRYDQQHHHRNSKKEARKKKHDDTAEEEEEEVDVEQGEEEQE